MTDIRRARSTDQPNLASAGKSEAPEPTQNPIQLIPQSSIATRSLVTIVTIMTFLAALTAGAAVLVNEASRNWGSQIAREMTIQIKPSTGRDPETDVNAAARLAEAFPGVASVRIFNQQESANLLEPWLGSGINLADLPIPRLIVVKPSAGKLDIAGLKARLQSSVPKAVLDDHRLWIERLTGMANALIALALVVFLLVMAAMTLAITFATLGAMAGTRDIIGVLHFVGAHDRFIAKEFQRHFFKLGLKGAVFGGAAALVAFGIADIAMRFWNSGPGSEQIESLFGTFSLGWQGMLAVACVAIAMPVLVGSVSRIIVYRQLQSLG